MLSCTSRTIYKKPKNLIEREQMIDLWTDIYIAKGARSVKTKTLRKNIDYIPLILKKYNIDSSSFSESNIYYTSKIDDYEKMFEEVQERLKALKEVYKPKDSITKVIEEELLEIDQKRLEDIMD